MVGGSSNILQDDKIEKILIGWEEDLTHNHACKVGHKKSEGEQENAENVLLFLNFQI